MNYISFGVHYTLFIVIVHCTLSIYSVQCTLYSVQCTVYIAKLVSLTPYSSTITYQHDPHVKSVYSGYFDPSISLMPSFLTPRFKYSVLRVFTQHSNRSLFISLICDLLDPIKHVLKVVEITPLTTDHRQLHLQVIYPAYIEFLRTSDPREYKERLDELGFESPAGQEVFLFRCLDEKRLWGFYTGLRRATRGLS